MVLARSVVCETPAVSDLTSVRRPHHVGADWRNNDETVNFNINSGGSDAAAVPVDVDVNGLVTGQRFSLTTMRELPISYLRIATASRTTLRAKTILA